MHGKSWGLSPGACSTCVRSELFPAVHLQYTCWFVMTPARRTHSSKGSSGNHAPAAMSMQLLHCMPLQCTPFVSHPAYPYLTPHAPVHCCVAGTRSIQMLYRAVLFTFAPTFIELLFVVGLLANRFSPMVAVLVGCTFALYVAWTLSMTQVCRCPVQAVQQPCIHAFVQQTCCIAAQQTCRTSVRQTRAALFCYLYGIASIWHSLLPAHLPERHLVAAPPQDSPACTLRPACRAVPQAAVEVRKQVNQLDNLTTSKAVDALLNAETVALFGNRQLEVRRPGRYFCVMYSDMCQRHVPVASLFLLECRACIVYSYMWQWQGFPTRVQCVYRV
jgi:hypothetical protein